MWINYLTFGWYISKTIQMGCDHTRRLLGFKICKTGPGWRWWRYYGNPFYSTRGGAYKTFESEIDFEFFFFSHYIWSKPTLFCICMSSKHAKTQDWSESMNMISDSKWYISTGPGLYNYILKMEFKCLRSLFLCKSKDIWRLIKK